MAEAGEKDKKTGQQKKELVYGGKKKDAEGGAREIKTAGRGKGGPRPEGRGEGLRDPLEIISRRMRKCREEQRDEKGTCTWWS